MKHTKQTSPTKTKLKTTPSERATLRAEMAELCAHLKDELENPNPFATALERQVVVLDRLLYAVMRRALKDDIENGDFNPDHLNKALRIQKQSMDGYKAIYTIEYMQNIMARRLNLNDHPSPLFPHEQTEET